MTTRTTVNNTFSNKDFNKTQEEWTELLFGLGSGRSQSTTDSSQTSGLDLQVDIRVRPSFTLPPFPNLSNKGTIVNKTEGFSFMDQNKTMSPEEPNVKTPTITTVPVERKADLETITENEAETEPDTTPQTEINPMTGHETEPEIEPEATPERESETKPPAKPVVEPKNDTDPETETYTDREPETYAERDTESEPETYTESNQETEAEPEPETGTDSEKEVETTVNMETQTDSQTGHETEPEPKVEMEIDTSPTIDPEVKYKNKDKDESGSLNEPIINPDPEEHEQHNPDTRNEIYLIVTTQPEPEDGIEPGANLLGELQTEENTQIGTNTDFEEEVPEGSNPPLQRGSEEDFNNGEEKKANIRSRSTDFFQIVQPTTPAWCVIR